MTTWGIIGTGDIAHKFVNDLRLVSSPQSVKAVLGHTPEQAEEFIKEHTIPIAATSLEDFIASGIDMAYIATPHPQHLDYALACVKNKIPVLCEKPITINALQCRKLIRIARQHNCFLMEGMWIRFLPSIEQVLSLVKSGKIGKIVSIKAGLWYKAPDDPGNRYFNPALGGGSLLDLGIYPIYLTYLLLGRPDAIKAIGHLSPAGIDETCSMLFNYKDGAYAILESSLIGSNNRDAEIIGDKGSIKIYDPWFEKAGGIELAEHGEGKIIYPCQWDGHGLQFEVEEMLRSIREQKLESDKLSHQSSLEMMEIMDTVRDEIKVVYEMYE
jgi:predicted dehydrogenase